MHIGKRLFLAAAMAAGMIGSVHAADYDLKGSDLIVNDVSQLAGYDGVTNSSDTLATLTFNLANGEVQSYGGLISGNIRLVKLGSKSKLKLTAANTHTGGTLIGTAGTDGGVIIVGNAQACGDPAASVDIKNFNTGARWVDGPWSALQIDVSGFANPISLPAGTTTATWAGNTYCNHSLCVTNDTNISIDSPITGGYFAFLGTKTFALSGAGSVSSVTFNGPITCTGMKVYSGADIHFRGAVTNSLALMEGMAYTLIPKFHFYSPQNNFNGMYFQSRRVYVYAEADNVLNGLDAFKSGSTGTQQLLLQGHDVTIGRLL